MQLGSSLRKTPEGLKTNGGDCLHLSKSMLYSIQLNCHKQEMVEGSLGKHNIPNEAALYTQRWSGLCGLQTTRSCSGKAPFAASGRKKELFIHLSLENGKGKSK